MVFSTFFSLFAIVPANILYVELRRVIGLQLAIKFLGLEGFGTNVINPSRCVIDSSPFINPYFNDLYTKCLISFQKTL